MIQMDTDDVFLSFTLLVTVVAVRTCYPCILGISLYPLLLKSRLILQYSICIVLHSKDTYSSLAINESAVPGSRQLEHSLMSVRDRSIESSLLYPTIPDSLTIAHGHGTAHVCGDACDDAIDHVLAVS